MFFVLSLFLACQDTTQQSSPTETAVNFYDDIQPILQQNCIACHQDGGQGVGDFSSYENVSAMAPLIAAAVEAGTMPPPVADPTCRDYKGSDILHLSEENKKHFSTGLTMAWSKDPNNATPIEDDLFTLTDADLTVMMTEPYEPQFNLENNPEMSIDAFPSNTVVLNLSTSRHYTPLSTTKISSIMS